MQLSSLLGHTQEILTSILGFEKPADALLDSFFRSRRYLGSHDRRFIAETAYGVLRHRRRVGAILDRSLRPGESELFDDDRLLLTIATYVLMTPGMTPLTAADLSVRIRSTRLKSQIETIFPRLAANTTANLSAEESIGIRESVPDWMVDRLSREYPADDVERMLHSMNEPAPITLRVNTLKTDVEECRKVLRSEGVETERTALSPVGLVIRKRVNAFALKSFQEGYFEVQDEGSQILPLLIDPKPTWKVLDACAGAGGKTLEFAAIMKNRGEIVAADVNAFRLEELKKRSRRAGASNIRIREVDALGDLDGAHRGPFDVVFVDAPCSGIGTVRRNPGMKWSVTPSTVDEISRKQSDILASVAPFVKPGGRLVYATCTVFRQENEDVVEAFLAAHPDFQPLDPAPALAKVPIPDAISGNAVKLVTHRHGTDGFFCAILERKKPN